ncbi:hypothetical protein [Acinetobacter sp. ANC 3813]|uniref:hypothetical protein n=1 Tax=Acinetobacter sp. ANC 3813 TaxID=1977873 RepID=UPI000A348A24|nr:hypothetical protein [Acinetobacter sp. ANC 3813]OTG87845.1 hypothetical protein B9T34_16040 [Acinetobacter sp. ANC 3813]
MINNIILNEILNNKDETLQLLKHLPKCAGFINFNEGEPIFIWHEKHIGSIGQKSPKCYNPDTDEYESMNILYQHWDEYVLTNGVFSAMDFRMMAAKCYPLEILGMDKLRQLLAERPLHGDFYNAVSDHYYRINSDLSRVEWWTGRAVGVRIWIDSYHSIEEAIQILISLDDVREIVEKQGTDAVFEC